MTTRTVGGATLNYANAPPMSLLKNRSFYKGRFFLRVAVINNCHLALITCKQSDLLSL